MGINVNITSVNKESNTISFTQDGESKVADVIFPAKIAYAKVGNAEIGLNPEGKVTFVKSLEPKHSGQSYPKKERTHNVYNEIEVSEGITLQEFKRIYNEMNNNIKINATNILNERLVEGKFLVDVIFFRTRFEKINPNDNTI